MVTFLLYVIVGIQTTLWSLLIVANTFDLLLILLLWNFCLCRVTIKLRFYPKDFVQEFMAEALSFLMRNAPTQQLVKGNV